MIAAMKAAFMATMIAAMRIALGAAMRTVIR